MSTPGCVLCYFVPESLVCFCIINSAKFNLSDNSQAPQIHTNCVGGIRKEWGLNADGSVIRIVWKREESHFSHPVVLLNSICYRKRDQIGYNKRCAQTWALPCAVNVACSAEALQLCVLLTHSHVMAFINVYVRQLNQKCGRVRKHILIR